MQVSVMLRMPSWIEKGLLRVGDLRVRYITSRVPRESSDKT
jgi:hypothetical protein